LRVILVYACHLLHTELRQLGAKINVGRIWCVLIAFKFYLLVMGRRGGGEATRKYSFDRFFVRGRRGVIYAVAESEFRRTDALRRGD
jgi:hypothetical protein